MILLTILEISISLLFFAGKLGVLIDKKFGWFVGALGASVGFFYFFLLNLYVFTVLEVGLVVLMGYGAFPEKWKGYKTERMIYLVIVVVMVFFTWFAFSGKLTVFETIASIGLVVGTYLLTHHRQQFGWVAYCIAHIAASYVGYQKDQEFFADFQVASAIVSLFGFWKVRAMKHKS